MGVGAGVNLPGMPRVWTVMAQRLQHAGAITVHALKDGDRGMAGENPKLQRDED